MKNKLIFLLFGALALALTSAVSVGHAANDSAASAKAAKLFDDPDIVRGNEFTIKRSQLDDAFIAAKAQAAAMGVNYTDAERDMLEVRLLNDLIVTKVLSSKATDPDKARAREIAEKLIADARKGFASEETFNTKLKLNKMTLDGLRQKLIGDALPRAVLEREMKTRVTISDEQVKRFYVANPAKFEEPESVRAAHILLGTRNPATGAELPDDQKAAKRKQADDLLKRVKAGEDFGKLARQYSEDPGSKDNGGEYTFPRGQMVPPFEAAAFSLKPGEVSPIVTTDFGFHIIKTLEKKPARTVPLSEVSDRVKEFLMQQEFAKLAPAFFEKIQKDAGVEILDPELKEASNAAMKMPVKAGDASSPALKP